METNKKNKIIDCKCCKDSIINRIEKIYSIFKKLEGWPWVRVENEIIDKNDVLILNLNKKIKQFLKIYGIFENDILNIIEELVNELHYEKRKVEFFKARYEEFQKVLNRMQDIIGK